MAQFLLFFIPQEKSSAFGRQFFLLRSQSLPNRVSMCTNLKLSWCIQITKFWLPDDRSCGDLFP